jgi:hypothetical protein
MRDWSSASERMMRAKIMNDSIKAIATKKKRKLSEKELMKRKFRKFLYDNDALFTWEYNQKHYSVGYSKSKLFNTIKAESWISYGFNWNMTIEGNDYWLELSVKWMNKCI